MKVEIRYNGRLEVILKPETKIESVILEEMSMKAAKGQPVKLEQQDATFRISVEN